MDGQGFCWAGRWKDVAGVRRGGLSLLGSLAAAGSFPQAVGDESDHHGIEINGRASWH